MRFSFSEWKRNMSIGYLNSKISLKEVIDIVVTKALMIEFLPIMVIMYMLLNIVALLIFYYFNLDYVDLIRRFNVIFSAFCIGNLIGFFTFIVICENRYKNKPENKEFLFGGRSIIDELKAEILSFKRFTFQSCFLAGVAGIIYLKFFG